MPLVLVTGFGPFEEVDVNPSEILARGLAAGPPAGVEIEALVLPVSFERAPARLERRLSTGVAPVPDLLLGLGVHKGSEFRVELRARAELHTRGRTDVDGTTAFEHATPAGPDLRTQLEDALRAFCAGREPWTTSEEAGGYVCERVYRAHLEQAQALGRPALFVHVPHHVHVSAERQLAELGALIERLV